MTGPQRPGEALRNATERIRQQREAAQESSRQIAQQRLDAEAAQPETPAGQAE